MNENKLVELSDGTLLLNSRMSNKAGYRYIAKSTDGGETWTDLQIERSLVDSKTPGRNASIIRRYPDAPVKLGRFVNFIGMTRPLTLI